MNVMTSHSHHLSGRDARFDEVYRRHRRAHAFFIDELCVDSIMYHSSIEAGQLLLARRILGVLDVNACVVCALAAHELPVANGYRSVFCGEGGVTALAACNRRELVK